MGLFTFMGTFRFRMILLHVYKAYHCQAYMEVFHPCEPPPRWVKGFMGGLPRL